ncbi:MAG: hypothetical protein HZA50_09845 [Planctomycetes bacterium]|nr:hypothetical protein [Planctomycetota bacterium]
MKNVALMLAVVAALGLVVGTIKAQQRNAPGSTDQPTTLEGKITKVANDRGVLQVTQKDAKESRRIGTTDKTAVTIDGKEAKVADLKEGMAVTVTYAFDGNSNHMVATKIEAKKTEDKKITETPTK